MRRALQSKGPTTSEKIAEANGYLDKDWVHLHKLRNSMKFANDRIPAITPVQLVNTHKLPPFLVRCY